MAERDKQSLHFGGQDVMGIYKGKQPLPPILTQATANTQASVEYDQYQIDIVRRISSLEQLIKGLTMKIEGFFHVNTVPINSLGHKKWELRRPINIAIEQRGKDEFAACLYDVNLFGCGDDIPEALDDLKETIVDQLEFLMEEDYKDNLGKSLKEQLVLLKRMLEQIDG